jgi:hypothetical protein
LPVSPGPAKVGGALFTSLDGFLCRLTVGNISFNHDGDLKICPNSWIFELSKIRSNPKFQTIQSHFLQHIVIMYLPSPRNTQNVVESPQQQKMGQARTVTGTHTFR